MKGFDDLENLGRFDSWRISLQKTRDRSSGFKIDWKDGLGHGYAELSNQKREGENG